MADPRKPYGEMARLWGSAKTYGEMRQACDRMEKPRYHMGRRPVYGRPRNRMGSRENVWENASGMGTAPAYGRPPGHMGNQNRMKAKNGTMEYGLRTACFHEFGGKR